MARTVSGELGIEGEKGKLWVNIARIAIRHKATTATGGSVGKRTRLLVSPAKTWSKLRRYS